MSEPFKPYELSRASVPPWHYRLVRTGPKTFATEKALPDLTGEPSWRGHIRPGKAMCALLAALLDAASSPPPPAQRENETGKVEA